MDDSFGHNQIQGLWKSFQEGDESSLGKIYTILFPKLCLFAYSYTRKKDLSENLVQDAFLKILENEATEKIYDIEKYLKIGIFLLWKTHDRNDRNRKKHLSQYRYNQKDQVNPKIEVDKEIMQDTIGRRLKNDDSKILNLVVEGYSNSEIAILLGINNRKVINKKYQIRQKLEKLIGGHNNSK
ncbi:MAG: ECF-type sigma factor [Bacteroidota bacterium]